MHQSQFRVSCSLFYLLSCFVYLSCFETKSQASPATIVFELLSSATVSRRYSPPCSFYVVLMIKPRASCMLGTYPSTVYPWPNSGFSIFMFIKKETEAQESYRVQGLKNEATTGRGHHSRLHVRAWVYSPLPRL